MRCTTPSSSCSGKGIYFSGGTATVRAVEIYSDTSYGLEYASSSSTVLTIVTARVTSKATSGSPRAVYITSGSPSASPATLKLVRCTLHVAYGSATIDGATSGRAVGLYGSCVANQGTTANVTTQISALTVSSNVT